MPKGDKFTALTLYLKNCGMDELKMSFSEIEKIIGFKLSDSAYSYPAQWSNSESQSFAFSWFNAGYLTRQVNISEQTVEFVREEVYNSRKRENISKRVTQPKMATLPVADAIRCICTYFNETVKDSHGRYLSWQHCYNAFILNRSNVDENTFDYLALHLAFYLASWGMYRGSSFLLQKDYKVHIPIVKIIMEKQKILLGTLGCVPAYDRYYVQAVKQYGISTGNYNRESVKDVAKYYLTYKDDFEIVRAELSLHGAEYPTMKLMDMCMWQVAFEKNK